MRALHICHVFTPPSPPKKKIKTHTQVFVEGAEAEPPTPHYSQGILQEGAHKAHLALLHAALGCGFGGAEAGLGKGVREALVLLKARGNG